MLQSITLTNYRNLNISTTLESRNLIIAPNGSGKSNLLEAIYVSALGKSFKPVESHADLIGPDGAFAKGVFVYDQHSLETVVSNTDRLQRKFILDGKHRPLSKVIGQFPVLIFAPHAVDLALGEPHTRRDDLDDFISLAQPQYHQFLQRYHQVLKNRNALLKNIRDGSSQQSELQYWSQEMVELAGYIFAQRYKFFEEISAFVKDVAAQIYRTHSDSFTIKYMPNTGSELNSYTEVLQAKLAANAFKEVAVGKSLYGPHKDDYIIYLNGQNLRYLGSRGQQRLSVFIWKLAQHQYLKHLSSHSALLLIDDLMSELDQEHRENAADYLLRADLQFVLTGAEKKDIPDVLINGTREIILA